MDREWTDKRMDDFADRVGRFEADVKDRFDKVDLRFDKLDSKLDKVIWTMISLFVTLLAAVIGKVFLG